MCWRMGSPTGSRSAMSAAIAQRPLASALLWFLSRSIVEGFQGLWTVWSLSSAGRREDL